MSKHIDWKFKGHMISWSITKPISSACVYDEEDNPKPISKEIFNTEIGIRKGDKLVILEYNDEPILTEIIRGKTLKNLFMTMEKGMAKILQNTTDNAAIVYPRIAQFLKPLHRLQLSKKFEENKLCVKDLAGDHIYYEGCSRKGKLWYFSLGS